MKRRTYQFGWLETKVKTDGSRIWVYRYREPKMKGGSVKRSVEVGSLLEYPTEALAWKQTGHLRLVANPENASSRAVTFGALADRGVNEVKAGQPPQEMFVMAKVRDVVEETPVCGITIYKSGCQLSGRTVGLRRKKDWEPVHEALPGCQRPAKASKIRIIERNNNRARLLEPICHGIHERSGAPVGVRLTSDFPALPCEHRRNPRRAAHV